MTLVSLGNLIEARSNLRRHQERLGCFFDLDLTINDRFRFNFAEVLQSPSSPSLKCYLDEMLLDDILHRREHWNNAELACRIEFDRRPNVYQPDAHMLMSFFQLPRP